MRVSIKAVGASGQGINSIGEVIAQALKRTGYAVFGYREYPSLIKGGHASYQLDIASTPVHSSTRKVQILITLNYHGLENNLCDLEQGGILIHDVDPWEWPKEDQTWIKENNIRVVCMPLDAMLSKLKARPILANVLLTSFVWKLLGQDAAPLKALVREQYEHKGPEIVQKNMECIDEGFAYVNPVVAGVTVTLPKPEAAFKDHLLVTGNVAMALGAVHGGLRMYVGYPMTPSSPLLSYLAAIQKAVGLVFKQAEDEITAIQMASGASFMGTRAMTATSGGGFDLMTETLSLNGMLENPVVINLAQRPGPATGLPTWTGQGDLLMAVHSGHGEFPRCVLSMSDANDGFSLMPEAFNLAEEWQLPVLVLSDKHAVESLWTEPQFGEKGTEVRRGKLVTDSTELKTLKSTDRYDPEAKDGVSQRWLPGANAATFCAQGDEHDGEGSSTENPENAHQQMEKRMRKMEALEQALPEPELYIDGKKMADGRDQKSVDILLVGWGSTKGVVLDMLVTRACPPQRTARTVVGKLDGLKVGYLHYTYLWPLKTERFMQLASKAKNVILIEGNYQGQLGMLIRERCGFEIKEKILKYDGRPFFLDELSERLQSLLP